MQTNLEAKGMETEAVKVDRLDLSQVKLDRLELRQVKVQAQVCHILMSS